MIKAAILLLTSFSVLAGVETNVLLPESYSRAVSGHEDYTQHPSPEPLHSLTIERSIDNALFVTIALADPIIDLSPACNPIEGTSMSEIYGLLTRWENLYSDTVTPQQAFNSVGSMFSDTDNLKTRVKAIRMLLKGECL